MRLAPDAVQNVERDVLTEGYKIKFPLFHKLFLGGVENFAQWPAFVARVGPQIRGTSKKPPRRAALPSDRLQPQPATSSRVFWSISKFEWTFCTSSQSSSASIRRIICAACCPSSLM